VTAVSLLAWLLYIDWQLTIICLVVMPVVTVCMRMVAKRLRSGAGKPATWPT
jgi:subfamily B ATP-binding cassette protein MsbA